MSDIDWKNTHAAIWRSGSQRLRPVHRIDPVVPEKLLGVERQKRALMENTRRFLHGRGANNALLWGSRGTGKSSLIKAMLNAYGEQGLRMIEVDADDLAICRRSSTRCSTCRSGSSSSATISPSSRVTVAIRD